MKKLHLIAPLAVIASILSVLSVSNSHCASEDIDVIASASKKYHYSKTSLTGKALQQVINAHQATFVLSTTNPDNSPNAGVFIPEMTSDSTVKFGLAENQTRQNIEKTKKAVLTVYKFLPEEIGKSSPQGARLILELIEEKSVNQKSYNILEMKIKKVIPLG